MSKLILGIETSCDDTSVCLMNEHAEVEALQTANKDFVHSFYGGVVPEIASRNHTGFLTPLIEKTIGKRTVDAIAVTNRPGLVGALMVGVNTAETLGWAYDIPVYAINHLEGHIYSAFVKDDVYTPPFEPNQAFGALVVSGGHTLLIEVKGLRDYKIWASTRDDAVGEAYDKVGKLLGLPFPGGPQVDLLAQNGNTQAFAFTRPMLEDHEAGSLEMSFSGLKTQASRFLSSLSPEEIHSRRSDFAASFSEAITETLIRKLDLFRKKSQLSYFVVVGGVSANSFLRTALLEWSQKHSLKIAIPPLKYCTDNAAMIARVALEMMRQGISDESMAPSSSSKPGDFK